MHVLNRYPRTQSLILWLVCSLLIYEGLEYLQANAAQLVFGQQQGQQQQPPTQTTITTTPPVTGATATTTTTTNNPTPLATDAELNDQFTKFVASLGGTAAAVSGGVGVLWSKFRSKTKNIDSALRGQDFDTRDLFELLNSLMVAGKAHPEMSFGQLLTQKAYTTRQLSDITILQAWDKEFLEFDEWFTKRYMVNPE